MTIFHPFWVYAQFWPVLLWWSGKSSTNCLDDEPEERRCILEDPWWLWLDLCLFLLLWNNAGKVALLLTWFALLWCIEWSDGVCSSSAMLRLIMPSTVTTWCAQSTVRKKDENKTENARGERRTAWMINYAVFFAGVTPNYFLLLDKGELVDNC